MSSQDQLTFLEDKVILIISSLGLVLISAVVFWVARQSAASRVPREDEGDEGLLGGRTRVVPGGREALKAARKDAKKRAKAEFKDSVAGQKRRNRVHERKRPVQVGEEPDKGDARKESPAELLRQLENYILDHRVSFLDTLESELSMSSADIAVKIKELETRGAFDGIMIDDARGPGERGRSFVRVGDDEMRTLAAVLSQRGRISVADFAAEANRVLQLLDGQEGATQTGRKRPDQVTRGCEGGTEAPSDGYPKGENRNKLSAYPSCSDGGTAAVVGPSTGVESSGICER